jgi:hypothetical protein
VRSFGFKRVARSFAGLPVDDAASEEQLQRIVDGLLNSRSPLGGRGRTVAPSGDDRGCSGLPEYVREPTALRCGGLSYWSGRSLA